jgi:hypothetical protein
MDVLVVDHRQPARDAVGRAALVVGVDEPPGPCSMADAANMSSFAREYSIQRLRDTRSIGLSFQRSSGP